jgi:hypothetical protein
MSTVAVGAAVFATVAVVVAVALALAVTVAGGGVSTTGALDAVGGAIATS